MKLSPITSNQYQKILKALVYSFVSGFLGSFVLVGSEVIKAAQNGPEALKSLLVPLVVGAVVAGINTALVAAKQLFTEES